MQILVETQSFSPHNLDDFFIFSMQEHRHTQIDTQSDCLPLFGQEDQEISQGPARMLGQSTRIIDTHSDLEKPKRSFYYLR